MALSPLSKGGSSNSSGCLPFPQAKIVGRSTRPDNGLLMSEPFFDNWVIILDNLFHLHPAGLIDSDIIHHIVSTHKLVVRGPANMLDGQPYCHACGEVPPLAILDVALLSGVDYSALNTPTRGQIK